jgi:hypothetical protein
MTRLAVRILTYIGAWWLTSAITFWAIPAAAEWFRQRRENTVAGQLRSIPQPPADATEAAFQRVTGRCGR